MGDIAISVLDTREQGGDSVFFDSNIYTPPTNRIVLAINYVVRLAVAPVITPVITGNNMTWTVVLHQTFDHGGTDRGALTIHRGLGSAPTSARTRATYSNTQLRNAMTILECVNVDISALGVNAIAQDKSDKIATGVTSTPSISLDNPASQSNNSVLGVVAYGEAGNPTVQSGTGFNLVVNNPTTEGGGNAVEFRVPFQQLTDWIMSSDAFEWAVAALELQNAETPPDPDAPQVIGRPSFISGNLITP